MNENADTDRQHDTQRRIVAVLLALALVAERASGRPRFVRALVAWALRLAEVTARDFVLAILEDMAMAHPFASARERALLAILTELSSPALIGHDRSSAAEALRLALSFRALAEAYDGLPTEVFEGWGYEDLAGFQASTPSLWSLAEGLCIRIRRAVERPEVRSGAPPQPA